MAKGLEQKWVFGSQRGLKENKQEGGDRARVHLFPNVSWWGQGWLSDTFAPPER